MSPLVSRTMLALFLGASSLIGPSAPVAASYQLPGCKPVNQTVSLEKEGCPGCYPQETTICSGYCVTKDLNKNPDLRVFQSVCTYQDYYYQTVQLPDCLPGVEPTVSYPVALTCHCSHCTSDTSDCTFQSLQPDTCSNQLPFYY